MEFEYTEEDEKAGLYKLSGSLIGEHDGMSLLNHFADRVEEGQHHFVIDLSAIKHINSTGLGVFITLLTKARKKGGEVVLVNPSEYIKNLLLITKLNSIFQIFKNDEEAILSFNK